MLSSFFSSLNVRLNPDAFEQALQDYIGGDLLGDQDI